jgi:putative transposase
LEKVFLKHKRPVGSSWRVDETCIPVKGVWKYRYRTVDKAGKTIDFYWPPDGTSRQPCDSSRGWCRSLAFPKKSPWIKGGANKSAIDQIIEDKDIAVEVRQIKHLNNIVEQDHRAVKLNTRPMLGFKSFRTAANVLAGQVLPS